MKKLLFTLFTMAILAACCTTFKQYRSSPEIDANRISSLEENEVEEQERIVLYSANIDMMVKSPDSANFRLAEIAKKYEGYVLVLGNRTSVIRVKAAQLNAAIAAIAETGKLQSKTISGQDVTDQYTDYQIRLDNALSARKRYLELLGKAENVEAALKVEKELERLNGEIDTMEGRLKRFEHLAAYSTITVDMGEQRKPGILGYVGIGLYRSIKWLFVRN
jgi:cell division protein ZapA (FtsZ GTPase activity inhibitor)